MVPSSPPYSGGCAVAEHESLKVGEKLMAMGQDRVKGQFLTHTLAVSMKYLVCVYSQLFVLCSLNIYHLSLNSSIFDIFAQIPSFPLK